jgi:DNA-binding Lrp family transcriptional regulator
VIKKFIPLIDNIAIGYECSAFLDIEVDPQFIESVAGELSKLDEIMVVYLMTGNVSLHAHALLRSNNHLADFLRSKIYPIKGINNVNASVMLQRYKTELNLL